MQGLSLKSPLELGKAKNGLYFLCQKCHNCCKSAEEKSSHSNCHLVSKFHNVSSVRQSQISIANKVDCKTMASSHSNDKCLSFADVSSHTYNDDELLWHARLGHVPFVKMRNISAIPVNFSPK